MNLFEDQPDLIFDQAEMALYLKMKGWRCGVKNDWKLLGPNRRK
jgi:hypothetical protein